MKKLRLPIIILNAGLLLLVSCYNKSPEKLPKFKRKFRTQIASFEKQKQKTDDRVKEGVVDLTSLQSALDSARNVDREFQRVYGRWENVDKQVKDLFKEYESLRQDADNLFSAMEEQTMGLNNEQAKKELTAALNKTRQDYQRTLQGAEGAIEKLRSLHVEAVDIIKALEVAVALGQIAQINEGLSSIESRVESIMADLNTTIDESKELYESRISGFN